MILFINKRTQNIVLSYYNCQALAPNPKFPSPLGPALTKKVPIIFKIQIVPRAYNRILCATPPTTTFQHEGGVPQKNSKNKRVLKICTIIKMPG